MWGQVCEAYSPDNEKHIKIKYTASNSQDGYEYIYFEDFSAMSRWVYRNYEDITIWEINDDRDK